MAMIKANTDESFIVCIPIPQFYVLWVKAAYPINLYVKLNNTCLETFFWFPLNHYHNREDMKKFLSIVLAPA